MFVLFFKYNKIENVFVVNVIILICDYMCLWNGMNFFRYFYEEEKLYSFFGYIFDYILDKCNYIKRLDLLLFLLSK